MQPQEFLTTLFIVITTAFALLMCVDFLAGLRNLIPASPQVTGSVTVTPDPLTLPEAQDCFCLSTLTTNALSKLPDPWTLPTQKALATVAAPKPEPILLLLPPSKNQNPETLPATTKSKRKTSIDAEFTGSTPIAKRRGRPRKTA